jgi:SagB-type dehydrogenase family enzyme
LACLEQPFVERAAAIILITGCFDRLRWKYGERAYRYMCMDIGYLGQNIYLVGEALNLGACAIAGFMDDAVEQFLGVDGRERDSAPPYRLGRRGLAGSARASAAALVALRRVTDPAAGSPLG